jgi:hypothetical protein
MPEQLPSLGPLTRAREEIFRKEIPEPFWIRLSKWLKEFTCVVVGHKSPQIRKFDPLFWINPVPGWPQGTRHKWTCIRCQRETRS